MRTDTVSVRPRPLTAEQAGSMLQRQVKKHHIAIILLHWFNAVVWLAELLTGLALVSSPLFRVAPRWYISIVDGVFGTRANMLQFHVALGLAWIGTYLVYGVFGFRTYLSREVLRNEIALDRDDYRWLVVRVRLILGLSKEPLPPQGIYNAGQKLFALLVYAMIPLVMVTGVVMAFRLFGTVVIGWAVVLHFCAVGAVVCGLLIHVYMGAVFPEEKPAFFSMITGSVNELFAYRHHHKWWAAIKAEEREWDRRHDDEAAAPPESAPAEPPAADREPGRPG